MRTEVNAFLDGRTLVVTPAEMQREIFVV